MAALLVTVACGVYSMQYLGMKSDRGDLINPDAPFQRRWQEYCERFRETNELLVVIEGTTAERSACAHWLEHELNSRADLYENLM
ncbi:MAG: hypothetical protein KDA78_20905, partial [Planctomycetaceae bacterium]|nr:hypothetical protein [Planctomycetaceae bacterium]